MLGVMAILSFQAIAAAGACLLLWILWRKFAGLETGCTIVALGFIGRAFGGQLLFWLSYLALPPGRSLQLGDGFWFFGLDGRTYFNEAKAWIAAGAGAVIFADKTNPNYLFVQAIALLRVTMGTAISTALFINLATFLGTALLIARWGSQSESRRTAALVTLGVFSFAPSLVLWSLQPLKDCLFILLVVGFVYGFDRWVAALRRIAAGERGSALAALGVALWLGLALHLIEGFRWYYACVLWMLFLPISTWGALTLRRGRATAMLAGICAFLFFGVLLVLNLPYELKTAVGLILRLPDWLFTTLQGSKQLFVTARASTRMEAGPMLHGVPYGDVMARGVLTLLPRFVAQGLGLASAPGGRGLWFFAELDTLWFNLVVIVAAWQAWRARPIRPFRRPVLLFLAMLFVSSVPLLYAVDNFGTLFRFREMFMIPLMLVPLALAGSPEDDSDLRPV